MNVTLNEKMSTYFEELSKKYDQTFVSILILRGMETIIEATKENEVEGELDKMFNKYKEVEELIKKLKTACDENAKNCKTGTVH